MLVTGATGFLGGAVLRQLLRDGRGALGQGRNPQRCAALQDQGIHSVCWTLPAPLTAQSADALGEIDAIIHCAALSAPFGSRAAFEAANVSGTRTVLDFARRKRVKRFVYISSPSIYFALRDQLDVGEDSSLPKPFNHYAASKQRAESLVRDARDVGPVILRPRGLYGPGDTTLLPRLLSAAEQRALPKFRGGRARIDLTYIDDAVSAVCAALVAPETVEGRAFNISGGEVIAIRQIVEQACDHAGVDLRWCAMPFWPALLAARVIETAATLRPGQHEPTITRYGLGLFAFAQSLNIARAQAELGWQPGVRFSEGVRRTFDKDLI